MATERKVIINGESYDLPAAWGDDDVTSLMASFKEASGQYVHVTLEDGVVHVLVNAATQVSVVLKTPRAPRQSTPRRGTIL